MSDSAPSITPLPFFRERFGLDDRSLTSALDTALALLLLLLLLLRRCPRRAALGVLLCLLDQHLELFQDVLLCALRLQTRVEAQPKRVGYVAHLRHRLLKLVGNLLIRQRPLQSLSICLIRIARLGQPQQLIQIG